VVGVGIRRRWQEGHEQAGTVADVALENPQGCQMDCRALGCRFRTQWVGNLYGVNRMASPGFYVSPFCVCANTALGARNELPKRLDF
jgi:hypothetical protein